MKPNDPVNAALKGLRARDGVRELLRSLGFDGPLVSRAPARLPKGVRCSGTITRDSCDVYVYRTPRFQLTDLRTLARMVQQQDPARHHLIVLAEPSGTRVALGCDALATGLRHIVLEPAQLRPSDAAVLHDMVPADDDSGTAHALRIMRALDQSRVTDRFFRDIAAMRDAVSRGWTGLPANAVRDRDALALLLLSRMMFLYFLQRRALLGRDPAYLVKLLRAWRRGSTPGTFYRVRLRTLFFAVLNTRPARRSARARALGELPYLNGGLFEPHALETARPDLDLPDDIAAHVFEDLLEKYRFTSGDEASSDGIAIDPEMLGRIFEGLMPGDRRSRTGSFYTPAPIVQRVVDETIAAHLAQHTSQDSKSLRILDPACGSGAFLLGAMQSLERLQPADDARTHIVGHCLHGVDLLPDAALICSLRLWLSLVPDADRIEDVPPLPNLDRRIRQGDALIDPLDVNTSFDATPPRALRDVVAALEPAATQYLTAGPETKTVLRRRLARLELRLARGWLTSMVTHLEWQHRDLAARAGDRDLFGDTPAHAATAHRRLGEVSERLDELRALRLDADATRTLPFFSFRVHFPEAAQGFDIVLSNPPWVRAHKWPPALRRALRTRYEVCRDGGWSQAARLTRTPAAAGGQVDLSLLFLERCIGLLAPGGTLGMLLPSKLMRSLYGAGARALLLREMEILSIEDHSLHQRAVFDADAFTMVLIARRRAAPADTAVRVRVSRSDTAELAFETSHDELPLVAGDPRAPWLVAPPACAQAFRMMQRAGPPVGEQDIVIRRGAMTRVNDVLLIRDFEPALGDIARIRTCAYERTRDLCYSAWVEASVVRPALRGADIRAWAARPTRHVLWSPANDTPGDVPPPRLRRFLARHRDALAQPTHKLGTLYRLSSHIHSHKVVWSDVASDLRAAPVPPTTRTRAGLDLPVIPLNTVYFIPTACERESLLLAAYLNSRPVRAFARAIAERAKDAHFRFFAWTIAVLPLPRDWRDNVHAEPLHSIACQALADGGLDAGRQEELDAIVARAYHLDEHAMAAIRHFDEWMRTEKPL